MSHVETHRLPGLEHAILAVCPIRDQGHHARLPLWQGIGARYGTPSYLRPRAPPSRNARGQGLPTMRAAVGGGLECCPIIPVPAQEANTFRIYQELGPIWGMYRAGIE